MRIKITRIPSPFPGPWRKQPATSLGTLIHMFKYSQRATWWRMIAGGDRWGLLLITSGGEATGPAYPQPVKLSDEWAEKLGKRQVAELRLMAAGPGSRPEIAAYIRTVIEQNTTPNPDTTAERLASSVATSVLSRLGAGYSISCGKDQF